MKESLTINNEFSVHTVLYNQEGFTIAFGKWGDQPSSLAVKWQNNPVNWFPLPTDKLFTREMVKGIMQIKSQQKKLDFSI